MFDCSSLAFNVIEHNKTRANTLLSTGTAIRLIVVLWLVVSGGIIDCVYALID